MDANSLGNVGGWWGKGGAGWAFARNTIVSPRHDKCRRIASHSEKSVDKPLGMLNYFGSRSRQDFGRVPAMHPIGGQIVYGPTIGKIVIGERPD